MSARTCSVRDAGFCDLNALYDFDRQLRLLVIDDVERVEVAARVAISDPLGLGTVFSDVCSEIYLEVAPCME